MPKLVVPLKVKIVPLLCKFVKVVSKQNPNHPTRNSGGQGLNSGNMTRVRFTKIILDWQFSNEKLS